MITPEILDQFKARMHLGDSEDENLMSILGASNEVLKENCGEYDIVADEAFRELVFERSRYVYNDALEYFEDNFAHRIIGLGMKKALEEMSDSDATV